MRILGIDCGTERTGWGVIESDGRRHRVVAHGVIRLATRDPLNARLAQIARELRVILTDHSPDAAAVEDVFYSQNVKSALKLAHARGVALLAIAEAGVALGEYSPLEVKMSVVGYGRAQKSQVALMVKSLTGTSDFKTNDASDAVAVAICHATNHQGNRVAAQAKAQARAATVPATR